MPPAAATTTATPGTVAPAADSPGVAADASAATPTIRIPINVRSLALTVVGAIAILITPALRKGKIPAVGAPLAPEQA